MPERNFRVGRSTTGLGLFAVRPIKKREYIVAYRGRRITTKESEEREHFGAKYMFEINSRWTIDGTSRHNVGRYLNHSCRPNAEPMIKRHEIYFRALRAIAPDEEITFDYGKEYFDLYIKPVGCRCAACKRKAAKKRKLAREARAAAKRNGC
jgi:SET domain-containing protein